MPEVRSRSAAPDADGWSTPSRSGAARPAAARSASARPAAARTSDRAATARPPAGRSTATRDSRGHDRANRLVEQQLAELDAARRADERGMRWWTALALLVVIAAIGGLIDAIGSDDARGGFNIGIVIASIVAILVVKRSNMFPIVISPPIVYSLGAVFQLYLRSDGLSDKKVVLDAAANYLVYGFPAIAAASAAVLIIAGIRLIVRR